MEVSWMRRKDLHIISTGNFMFTADSRFYVIHPEHDPAQWTLQLRNARLEDEGLYECQVNTDPKMKRSVLLTVAVKSALKGTRFQSVEAVKEKAASVMQELSEKAFQHCFEQW
uniref:Ig-like domain-containing protein n=1 Tax=Rhodnius prolixus TaxID=13249 RepID=T1HWL7_RHOPR